jgi:hypothetical protein
VKVVADDLDLAGQNRLFGARGHLGRQAWPGRLRDSRASPIGLTAAGAVTGCTGPTEVAGAQPLTVSLASALEAGPYA